MEFNLKKQPSDFKPIVKEDIFANDAFLLHNVFSPSECELLIKQSEEEGYLKLCDRTRTYRTNDRVEIMSPQLSEFCFERIKSFLPKSITVKPEDSDVQWLSDRSRKHAGQFDCGDWNVDKLNPNWRFCRYDKGGFFKPHRDGCFIESADCRSILTVNIYLNDTEGGATNFLKAPVVEDESRLTSYENCEIIHSVQPKAGTALVFVHWLLHEGSVLQSDIKYLVRSDVMYQRADLSSLNGNMREGFYCFKQAEEFEAQGKPNEAVQFYRRAFKLWPDLEHI